MFTGEHILWHLSQHVQVTQNADTAVPFTAECSDKNYIYNTLKVTEIIGVHWLSKAGMLPKLF